MKQTDTQGFSINVTQDYFAEGSNRKYVLTATSLTGHSIKKTRTTAPWIDTEIVEVVNQLMLKVMNAMAVTDSDSSSSDIYSDWNASKSSWNY